MSCSNASKQQQGDYLNMVENFLLRMCERILKTDQYKKICAKKALWHGILTSTFRNVQG